MGYLGKFIGAGVGFWVLGGPIGAIVGAAVGSIFDNASVEVTGELPSGRRRNYSSTNSEEFSVSFLVLAAAVMKADGKVMKSELDYVKQFMRKLFGSSRSVQLLPLLQDILKKDIHIGQVCTQIRTHMNHSLRLQLLHFLFGVAHADGHIDRVEIDVIAKIASYLGISQKDFKSIQAMFIKDAESAYKILEIPKSASDIEVKKAYRKMAIKYHPDKVSQLGEQLQNAAKEKFQKVQDAYEAIKKERGIS